MNDKYFDNFNKTTKNERNDFECFCEYDVVVHDVACYCRDNNNCSGGYQDFMLL